MSDESGFLPHEMLPPPTATPLGDITYEEFIPASYGQPAETRYVSIRSGSIEDNYRSAPSDLESEGWGVEPAHDESVSAGDERRGDEPRYVKPSDFSGGSEITYELAKGAITNPVTTLGTELDKYNIKSVPGRKFKWNEASDAWKTVNRKTFQRTELDAMIANEMNALLRSALKRDASVNTEISVIPLEKIWIPLVARIEAVDEDKEVTATLLQSAKLLWDAGEEVGPVMINKGTQLSALINVVDHRPVLEERYNKRFQPRFHDYLQHYRRHFDAGFNPYERPEAEPEICGIGNSSAGQQMPLESREYVERGASPPPPRRSAPRPSSPATALGLMFGVDFHAMARTDPGHRI
ncbi:hypothetical protein QR680_006123 [Steinernema hermaphroditum]|uniref:Uncharacterized protein n=1 Tax=Steinernema hermaphroditum TaxID=289476 RepID=A0AA39HWT0_9BILA|nr:hypothetical protein QR680_006123 [Steinernema hermaphroditum]